MEEDTNDPTLADCSMETEIIEDESGAKDMEKYALTIGRYDEIINSCKCLRARLLFMQSCLLGGHHTCSDVTAAESEIISSVEKAEGSIHIISIQEEALKLAKMSRLVANACEKGLAKEDASILSQHAAFQTHVAEKVKELNSAKRLELQLKRQLAEQLLDYKALIESNKETALTTCINENPKNNIFIEKSKKYVKDIRFMQILISETISAKKVDLRSDERMKSIVQSLRDPITTVEQFFDV